MIPRHRGADAIEERRLPIRQLAERDVDRGARLGPQLILTHVTDDADDAPRSRFLELPADPRRDEERIAQRIGIGPVPHRHGLIDERDRCRAVPRRPDRDR